MSFFEMQMQASEGKGDLGGFGPVVRVLSRVGINDVLVNEARSGWANK
jgi:hypothetical protein